MKTRTMYRIDIGRHLRRRGGTCCLLLGAFVGAAAGVARAQQADGEGAEQARQTSEMQITADTVDMNFGKKTATFAGNVVVADDRMRLTADTMTVWLSETDELQRIEAKGNVVIEQLGEDRRAESGKADYEVEKGTVVLTENPVVFVGKSSATGAQRIIYFRNTETFRFEGDPGQIERPTITVKHKVQKGKEGALPLLLGEDRKDEGGKDKP